MMADLTDTTLRLAARFLDDAADEYSNHGCNDVDLKALIPDEDERREICRNVWESRGEDPDDVWEEDLENIGDDDLMRFLAVELRSIRMEWAQVGGDGT